MIINPNKQACKCPNKENNTHPASILKPLYGRSSISMIEVFLKQEINGAKNCACDDCDFRRKMLRRLQEIVREYKEMKSKEHEKNCKRQ